MDDLITLDALLHLALGVFAMYLLGTVLVSAIRKKKLSSKELFSRMIIGSVAGWGCEFLDLKKFDAWSIVRSFNVILIPLAATVGVLFAYIMWRIACRLINGPKASEATEAEIAEARSRYDLRPVLDAIRAYPEGATVAQVAKAVLPGKTWTRERYADFRLLCLYFDALLDDGLVELGEEKVYRDEPFHVLGKVIKPSERRVRTFRVRGDLA